MSATSIWVQIIVGRGVTSWKKGVIDGAWFIPDIGGCQVAGMKCMMGDVRSEENEDQAHLRPCEGLKIYLQGWGKLLQGFENESDWQALINILRPI